jgi:hypothetical protein
MRGELWSASTLSHLFVFLFLSDFWSKDVKERLNRLRFFLRFITARLWAMVNTWHAMIP